MQHELKSIPPFFQSVLDGRKTFEIRRNDRNYKDGDILHLREYNGHDYTNRDLWADVTHVTDYQQQPGYVVMAIKVMLRPARELIPQPNTKIATPPMVTPEQAQAEAQR